MTDNLGGPAIFNVHARRGYSWYDSLALTWEITHFEIDSLGIFDIAPVGQEIPLLETR